MRACCGAVLIGQPPDVRLNGDFDVTVEKLVRGSAVVALHPFESALTTTRLPLFVASGPTPVSAPAPDLVHPSAGLRNVGGFVLGVK